jgi:hypothetical protein
MIALALALAPKYWLATSAEENASLILPSGRDNRQVRSEG